MTASTHRSTHGPAALDDGPDMDVATESRNPSTACKPVFEVACPIAVVYTTDDVLVDSKVSINGVVIRTYERASATVTFWFALD